VFYTAGFLALNVSTLNVTVHQYSYKEIDVIVAFSYCILILLALLLCSFLHYILSFVFPTVHGE